MRTRRKTRIDARGVINASQNQTALLAQPFFWLMALMVGVTLFQILSGNLIPQDFPDSRLYRELASRSLMTKEAFVSIRTLGYPLYLKMSAMLGLPDGAIPFTQLFLFFSAVLGFYVGTRHYGFTPWYAFAAAAVLMLSEVAFSENHARILTDSLGASLAIACISLTFVLSKTPTLRWAWIMLTGCVAYAYHVRPAYLFLVGLIPALGIVLMAIALPRERYRRFRWHFLARLSVATVLPLFLFSLFREVFVQDFGLVCFSSNSIGPVAGQLLDESLLPHLPEKDRPLARAFLARSKEIANDPAFGSHGFQSPVRGRGVSRKVLELQHTAFAARVISPVLERFFGTDQVASDRATTSLSLSILRLRWSNYLAWWIKGFQAVLAHVLSSVLVVLLLFCFAGLSLVTLVRIILRGQPPVEKGFVSFGASDRLAIRASFWTGALFFLAKTFVIVTTNLPITRYIQPAIMFLPMTLSTLLTWMLLIRHR